MGYGLIVSDFNGTIFEYTTDEIQNKKIAYAVLDDAKRAITHGKFWRAGDIIKLVKTKKELEKRLQEYNQGKRHLWDVYEPFNDNILKGRDVVFINRVVAGYAQENAGKVDGRVMRPLRAAHKDGKETGILSVSYDYSIMKILDAAGYSDVFDRDNIIANTMRHYNNKATGLTLDIYEKKPTVMIMEFFRKRGFRWNETLYFGDTDDDEPIADVLDKGNFIVPFFATDEFRQKMASKHNAFVPKDEADLDKYLKSR